MSEGSERGGPESQHRQIAATRPKRRAAETEVGKHFIAIGVITVLVVGALLFWWRSTFYEDTDDAQINGHLVQISSRIAGQVIKLYVDENQQVKAGTRSPTWIRRISR